MIIGQNNINPNHCYISYHHHHPHQNTMRSALDMITSPPCISQITRKMRDILLSININILIINIGNN
ncbi:hypothetical protein Hanom_Chr01g00028911 [Helianthus anomalus]